MNHSVNQKNSRTRGTLYWRPGQVRVWINGKFFDLGERSLSSSRVVADELGLRLVIQQSLWPSPPSATVVRRR
jgi:hypothetical protein